MGIESIGSSESVKKVMETSKKADVKADTKSIKDNVNISQSAKIYEEAIKKAKVAKTDKTDEINRLKKQIENKEYKVDSKKTAQAIINHAARLNNDKA